MRAIQSYNGAAKLVQLSEPTIEPQHVKVKIKYSSVSIGTELLMIRSRSDAPLGYSAAGVVTEVGEGVTHVQPGDRVACYGTPAHREYMLSPKHLTAKIPAAVSMREAAFAGIGAIAIHALRQAGLTFGESAVVMGAGILGQLIAAIANASNYRVIGLDPIEERRTSLKASGIRHVCKDERELEAALKHASAGGLGADAVLICASTRSDNLINKAIGMLRDRGTVVIVGDTGSDIDRDLLFAKEANVVISRAGGPGRYEKDYERLGFDYPIGYVRWTEGRNMEQFLAMLEERRIDVSKLITNEVAFHALPELYTEYEKAPQGMLGIVASYT